MSRTAFGSRGTWDLCLARRAAAIGGVAVCVALIVVAATDAGGPWSARLGMTAALAPLCGALGTLAAVRLAAGKGELLALAALGADPGRAVLGAAVGGCAIGVVGLVVGASGAADLASLFPRVASRVWVTDGAGLHELSLGLHIGPGGALSFEAAHEASAAIHRGADAFALATIGAAALACPAWLAAPGISAGRRVSVGGLSLAAAIVAFQGVAAGRFPPLLLAAAPLVLLAEAVSAHVRTARSDVAGG